MSHNGKSGVRHATDVMVPYAVSAKENAERYAHQAQSYLAPRARRAAVRAREGYVSQVAPRVERARAAAGPAGQEAAVRSQAALAALRGDVTPGDIRTAVKRRRRRERGGRKAKRLMLFGIVAGGAFAAWRWWNAQSGPEWLMEPAPAGATEAAEEGVLD
ncbi:DUF5324 family protein [Streptomyces sp. DSM 44917]|uniref:DUF5324 family protein n=1 Tax=Streptomyces boetiae TaxID=3075541 RepID=A0ABU2L610_9ACTN|nr:DUF5324 family protein [Streptomyces sp. DSM 44917]MDT0307000.1 DUF5324 family protein [Streptomyces sp. DSM 44917]